MLDDNLEERRLMLRKWMNAIDPPNPSDGHYVEHEFGNPKRLYSGPL